MTDVAPFAPALLALLLAMAAAFAAARYALGRPVWGLSLDGSRSADRPTRGAGDDPAGGKKSCGCESGCGCASKSRESRAIFVFEGEDLIDATEGAEGLLAQGQPEGSDWTRMLSALAPFYPHFADRVREIDRLGRIHMRPREGRGSLTAIPAGGRIRVTLTDTEDPCEDPKLDAVVFHAMTAELEVLRTVTAALPFPLWRETAEAEIIWTNSAYLGAAVPAGTEPHWPPPRLFPRAELDRLEAGGPSIRLGREEPGAPDSGWYECRAQRAGSDMLYSALPAEAAVSAERRLGDFMRTLTQTFSQLATGLAIFGRERRLTLFNPALSELTGLPADFLAGKPSLAAFLDRLREGRMLPEPKDYGSWRRHISQLEAAADAGTYSETWSLADGRTFRITGRPHPDGALAFLFDDISEEMTATRRFRIELELGQAVVDALDEAVAVFSSAGTLVLVNRAYQDLWASDVDETLAAPTVTELTRQWMARCEASPVWGDVRDFALHDREREPWEETVRLKDGGTLLCRVKPLPGGSTLVVFAPQPRSAAAAQRASA